MVHKYQIVDDLWHNINFKGELHPKTKLNIYCELSQNYQHWLRKKYRHFEAHFLKKLKNGIMFLVDKLAPGSCPGVDDQVLLLMN